MTETDTDTDQLLTRYSRGENDALQRLLTRYRERLRRMISVFLDPRVSARVDPSDVLQESLAVAAARLPGYLENRPIPFYPWLRQIVRDQLIQVHRQHVTAARRSVRLESQLCEHVSDTSACQLADRLISRETSPSQHVHSQEMRRQVKAALARLSEADRELLLMRWVEQLSTSDIATVLGISETAAKSRLRRGLQRLYQVITNV